MNEEIATQYSAEQAIVEIPGKWNQKHLSED